MGKEKPGNFNGQRPQSMRPDIPLPPTKAQQLRQFASTVSTDASNRVKGSAGNVSWAAPISGGVSYVAKALAKKWAVKGGAKSVSKK